MGETEHSHAPRPTAASIAAALEREHRQIDEGIEAFLEDPGAGPEPLQQAFDALRRHIYLEEELLFDTLRDAGLVAPVFVMLREHGEIWSSLDAIEGLRRGGAARGELDDRCRALLAQLERHNSKEEPILYTRADDVLDDTAAARLRGFLATGRIPPGWICARADET